MNCSYTDVVTAGSKKASALGFPTINIPLSDELVSGVYAGKVKITGKSYIAAVYADQRRKILEAHLIDLPDIVVNGMITIELGIKIREDRAFNDDETLKLAIADDVRQVRMLYSSSAEH